MNRVAALNSDIVNLLYTMTEFH